MQHPINSNILAALYFTLAAPHVLAADSGPDRFASAARGVVACIESNGG